MPEGERNGAKFFEYFYPFLSLCVYKCRKVGFYSERRKEKELFIAPSLDRTVHFNLFLLLSVLGGRQSEISERYPRKIHQLRIPTCIFPDAIRFMLSPGTIGGNTAPSEITHICPQVWGRNLSCSQNRTRLGNDCCQGILGVVL